MAAGRIGGRPAGFPEYEKFFKAEQLHKFSPTEVGFHDESKVAGHCRDCYHWFVNQVSGWTPCEIMHRPGHQAVPAGGVCRFFTPDGKTYPLLEVL